jgi:hypothetical protein
MEQKRSVVFKHAKRVAATTRLTILTFFSVFFPFSSLLCIDRASHQQQILMMLVSNLRGLKKTDGPLFEYYVYLAETLALVKVLVLLLESENPDEFVRDILNEIFTYVR